ncbi:MAG: DNA translocase FtsK 4TM domain-containing protein [Thermodesulfobacteriota bacterium]|nr:DNA translocase FtsK 4TM domain-containing protein [Deltaproteobacteria bacterium TMED58]RZP15857.1 MAG: DNA translocase FtsK [Candidatus Dadabacteria bacterium]|tara:strand:+ start:6356 stop:8467 length:2112 start_codon:yes stop_codon:yes gene_type:complete
MLKSKEKLLNLTKVFFKYFFALLGIIVSLILTLGIAVNLLELSNTGSLIGNFGFLIADKFYYYFGTPGLIISISGFIASARFLTNNENKEISKKIFFVLLITIATGGLFKIFKELFSIAEYKFIGFIPSKITAFLVKQITGYLGTTLFYLFILFFSIQQLNKELISKLFNKFINLIKSIFLKKSNNKKAINIKEKPNDEIKINIEETLESNPVIDIQPDTKEEDKISPKNLSNREGKKYSNFILPNLDLLDEPKDQPISYDKEKALDKAKRIKEKLENFGINGQITEIKPGPVITLYEYRPEAGTKINKISSLSDDLAMALKATRIRIIAPIPGKDVIGIEVPNDLRETVYLKELLSKDQFKKSPSPINLSLGKDISGIPLFTDLKTAPHLMIAGTTGSGKSVFLHSIITSMLYKATPKELKFIMIDPKMLELSGYEDIPHLLHPVVTNPKKASAALKWAVKEMETRYKLLSDIGVRDIDSYNKKIDTETENLPFIVIIIDELADLMFVAPNEIKESITRLSQMARAAGIHLIVASQRPSADVVAGLIKANFPARISFAVSSKIDSRIILDASGAEELLGKGDMLLLQPPNNLIRIQGSIISDKERNNISSYLKEQAPPDYNSDITKAYDEEEEAQSSINYEKDALYDEALDIVKQTKLASISMIQRRLKIGYNRAANIIEMMEREGIVGEQESAGKPRKVFL